MNIRRAEEKDIAAVQRLLTQVVNLHHAGRPDLFGNATKYSAEELKALFRDDSRPVFVAADETDETMGYIFCALQQNDARHFTPHKTLYIDDLCIDERMRGQRIGKALYEHARAFALREGCHNITLHVWALNADAEAFYRHLGMETQYTSLEEVLS